MVTFTQIAHAIKENKEKDFSVQSCIHKHPFTVECFQINSSVVLTKEDPFGKIGLRLTLTVPILKPAPGIVSEMESDSESDPLPTPVREVIPEPTVQKKVQDTKEYKYDKPQRQGRPQDPICIGISQRDPMYEIASPSVKQSIEAEEARLIEAKIAELYKSESGRSRGWTKTYLEAFIQPRVSTGGTLHPKQQFPWGSVFTDKQVSAALDFLCLAKEIRLAVWNDDERCVGIWPAADHSESKQSVSLYHVDKRGAPLQKTSPFEAGWCLRATLSVEHGLEKLSIDELDSLAEKMGIELSGKKTERVRTLASARTKQRLMV